MYPIIIVNWNNTNDTIECINSLLKLRDTSIEILVWDNDSNKSQKALLSKATNNHPTIKCYYSSKNIGFTKACNVLMKEILIRKDCPKYLALLNNDTIVDPLWLKQLILTAERNESGITSSRMVRYYETTKIDNLGHKMLTSGEIIPIHSNTHVSTRGPSTNLGACAGAALYSTKMLKMTGTFDNFFDTGYEDAELGFRAYMCGYEITHCDTAIVYHKGGASIARIFSEEFAIKEQINILYSVFKCYPWSLLIIYIPLITIRQFLITIIGLLVFRVKISKVIFKSQIQFYRKHLTSAIRARKTLNRKKNILQIITRQDLTVLHDLKRFWSYVINGNPSNLEKYNG